VDNEESRKLDGVTLFIDHDFGWGDFRSTTAWRTFETVNREDEDGTNRIACISIPRTSRTTRAGTRSSSSPASRVTSTGSAVSATTPRTRSRPATRTRTRTASNGVLNLAWPARRRHAVRFHQRRARSERHSSYHARLGCARRCQHRQLQRHGRVRRRDLACDRPAQRDVRLRYTHDEKQFSWFNARARRRNSMARSRRCRQADSLAYSRFRPRRTSSTSSSI